MIVRPEIPEDVETVSSVIEAAFGKRSIAEFAERIRASRAHIPQLAYVVEVERQIVAHTMLSRVVLKGPELHVLMLTPMSVRPDYQRRGVGRALVEAVVAAADEQGEPLVFVEGVPAYYPRVGFRSASALGFEPPDPNVPDEAWMVRTLRAYDPQMRGRVVYGPFFPEPPSA